MSIQLGHSLARLTIAAPTRRIDLALPEQVPLAELMPTLLRYVGDSLRDPAPDRAGGWMVCRADGSKLDFDRALSAQHVRDGEILHLVPKDTDWPEPEYDDLVLSIAEGSRTLGARWRGQHTRIWALTAAGAMLTVGLPVVLRSGPPWWIPALGALAVAGVLLVAGTVLARAGSDSAAGAIVATFGAPYAFLGGFLILGGHTELRDFGGPHLLVGSTLLLLAALLGLVGTADQVWLSVAAMTVALLGVLGAGLLALTPLTPAGDAAIVVSAALALMAVSAQLAVRLAKMPMPELPQTPADLLADRPLPPRAEVFGAVARAGDMFTGLLLGVAVTTIICDAALLAHPGIAGTVLAGIVSALCLIRARTLPLARQRLPVLVAGTLGLAVITTGLALTLNTATRAGIVFLGLLPAALLVVAAGVTYARRRPSPLLGRLGDLLDSVLSISVLPAVCAVLGLYSVLRGLAG